MYKTQLIGTKLALICFIAIVLFNPPVLSLFNQKIFVLGFPLLFLYLFGSWATIIFIAWFLINKKVQPQTDNTSGKQTKPESKIQE